MKPPQNRRRLAPQAKPSTAVAKPAPSAPWPTQQKVKDLARYLDRGHRYLDAMMEIVEKHGNAPITPVGRSSRTPKRSSRDFELTGWRSNLKSGRVQKLWDECCPENLVDPRIATALSMPRSPRWSPS